MISIRLATMRQWVQRAFLLTTVLALVSCAEVDDTTGSRLVQPAPGSPPVKPIPANDITIVGQEVGHAIIDLPEVANAAVPPLVEFTGVTSIIASPVPIDTDPYTDLLRDRLLLITRLKLRFVEKTLPPLVIAQSKKTKKKQAAAAAQVPPQNTTNPDYQILAELRGRYDDELYKIQVEFVNVQTGDVLFNQLYSIRKEAQPGSGSVDQPEIDPADDRIPPPGAAPAPDSDAQPPASNPAGVQ